MINNDTVNHPAHYTKGKVECIDAIESAVTGLKGMEAVLTGNIIKYVWRWKHKNSAEDLRKAKFYLTRLIDKTATDKHKRNFKWVYICSPYHGDTQENTRKALKYCQFAAEQKRLPICPHVYFTRFLDDNNPVMRALGLMYGLDLMFLCDEIWVCGETVSEGMSMELKEAKEAGIPIKEYSEVEVDRLLKEADCYD